MPAGLHGRAQRGFSDQKDRSHSALCPGGESRIARPILRQGSRECLGGKKARSDASPRVLNLDRTVEH